MHGLCRGHSSPHWHERKFVAPRSSMSHIGTFRGIDDGHMDMDGWDRWATSVTDGHENQQTAKQKGGRTKLMNIWKNGGTERCLDRGQLGLVWRKC